MSDFTFKDNTDLFLSLLKVREEAIAESIGQKMEEYSKNNLNTFVHNGKTGYVDTGRAKNSITYTYDGNEELDYEYFDDKGNKFKDKIPACKSVGTDKIVIYVGSNVEYFPYLERGTQKLKPSHALQRAITEHKDEYKKMAIDGLKGLI